MPISVSLKASLELGTDNTPTVSRFLPFPFNPFKWLKAKSSLLFVRWLTFSLLGESASSTESLFPLSSFHFSMSNLSRLLGPPRVSHCPSLYLTNRSQLWGAHAGSFDPDLTPFYRQAVSIFLCWLSRHIVLDLFLIFKIRILCLCCLLVGKTYASCLALLAFTSKCM